MAQARDPYDFDNEVGWRRYRVLRPCRGIYHDIKRRLPYYWSDIADAFTYRTFASTVRIFFVKSASLRTHFTNVLFSALGSADEVLVFYQLWHSFWT